MLIVPRWNNFWNTTCTSNWRKGCIHIYFGNGQNKEILQWLFCGIITKVFIPLFKYCCVVICHIFCCPCQSKKPSRLSRSYLSLMTVPMSDNVLKTMETQMKILMPFLISTQQQHLVTQIIVQWRMDSSKKCWKHNIVWLLLGLIVQI